MNNLDKAIIMPQIINYKRIHEPHQGHDYVCAWEIIGEGTKLTIADIHKVI